MAHVWVTGAEGWSAVRLTGSGLHPLGFSRSASPGPAAAEDVRILRVDSGAVAVWVLISPLASHGLVNGRAPVGGLRVLRDRDEIRAAGGRCYFSEESLAEVKPFVAAERTVYCGRCRQPIDAGALSVRCPGCGIAFHQAEDLPCFTYDERCPFCGKATALDAGFSWVPEE